MKLLSNLASMVTGKLPSLITDAIHSVLPLSPEDRAKVDAAVTAAAHEHELALLRAMGDAEQQLTARIAKLEGTASDLKGIPILGPVMIFLRGAIRPAFGMAVLIWDWKVLSGGWAPPDRELFFAINVLVLGFHFGERAVKNVLPTLAGWKNAAK